MAYSGKELLTSLLCSPKTSNDVSREEIAISNFNGNYTPGESGHEVANLKKSASRGQAATSRQVKTDEL